MLSLFVLVCLLQVLRFGLGQTSDCSQLTVSSPYIVSDDSYAIITNNIPSSTVIQVSLMRKQPGQDTSWFVMGASDSTEFIGSWQPFTSADGEMIDCSTSSFGEQLEQIVTNKDSRLTTANRTVFMFYWMPPSTFNGTVTFLARISLENTTDRFIQSLPVTLGGAGGRQRLQDVPANFCNSAPCLNGGACVLDPQYSFCRCVPPWNGFTCNLQYFHIMLGSNLTFGVDYYFNTLNSPTYAALSTDLFTWFNSSLPTLPANRLYSINFVAPSPFGTYISVSMALTPPVTPYTSTVLSALSTALLSNPTTPLGRQLTINPTIITNSVTQDGTPLTSCVFPFALVLVDYNFCIPLAPSFVCSRSRVIDRNATLDSIDCSRNLLSYVPKDPCFPNICLNGGTCNTVNGLAVCTCSDFFTGARCNQLFGCNPLTDSRAVSCVNSAACVGNTCVCRSNDTVGTLCEVVAGNTGCVFPFTYMTISYSTCMSISAQSLCVARNAAPNGQFPVSLVGCGSNCASNQCANRGTCQNTNAGFFRCINCASGYSGYFCELQFRTIQIPFNLTYIPDFRNLSSNASQQLQALINQTLSSALNSVTTGGFRPDLVQIVQNADGTTSVVVNVVTNYVNYLTNATQGAFNGIGAVSIVLVNTTRDCAPWYIYEGRNVTGCVTNAAGVPICSLTNNFDRDGQFTSCSEPINYNLCNTLVCGDGRCIVTSRNLTYCRCPLGITGANCDQLIQCSDINCLNNGTCSQLTSGFFRCICPPGYGGNYCQLSTTGCVFPFVDNQNRTQNTCITTSDYLNGTVPWCRNALNQSRSCQIDYCAQRPCQFGVCIPASRWAFGNSYQNFICNCTPGFTGRLCTHAYFRVKTFYAAPNISTQTLNAIESPSTQAYQNLSLMFRNLVRNRTNSSFEFLPLLFTTFRPSVGNFYQVTAEVSFPGNISSAQIASILTPILTNPPPQFNITYVDNGSLDPEEIISLSPASNCTLPYGYNSLSLAVCRMDVNGIPYCSYGQVYTIVDRKPCDASGLAPLQYTACETLNITNPCNSTADYPIRCIGADDGWTCFCEVTQTIGRNCANLDFCRNGSLLCRNNATCVNRPDLSDFACNCTDPYYGRFCENFGLAYRLFLVNYSNLTSPGIFSLTSAINQTIINITRGAVYATSIVISPSGEVTVVVNGRNYSIPQLDLGLLNQVNNNWTAGPYLVTYNQTNLVPIQSNASCVFPFAFNGVNYTTCITTGFGFPWCSSTPVFTGRIVDCRTIDWCASGPCLNNGTCRNDLVRGTFSCICADGWLGVQCAYPSRTVTIVIPLGNNTFNNLTFIDIGKLFPNTTNSTLNIETIRPGPNNTIIITVIVNGTNVPNVTYPNVLNVTTEPTKNINGCVFPFIYNNRSYTSCIPIALNRSTYCCQNANCDLNPQWQFCNTSNVCAACAPSSGCTINPFGIISCFCQPGFSGVLCDSPLDLCALSNRSCLNNGTCAVNPITSAASCNCTSALFFGPRCESYFPCLFAPCLNNGVCSPGPNGTVLCNCTNCYSGPVCQNIDYCCLNVCGANGLCLSGFNNSYTCICQPGFTGQNCTIINACASNPCLFGGSCLAVGNNSFLCICPTNFFGTFCNQSLCTVNPCLNGGACQLLTNGSQGYVCLCPPNYGGVNCSLLNPCASLPCLNNGTCIYLNGTTFQCVCPPGRTGLLCDAIVNPCNSIPCRNNGQCLPLGDQFLCICPPGFNGTLCDALINPCGSNPCLNNGSCFQQINNITSTATGSPLGYVCVCNQTLFSGARCEILLPPCPTNPGITPPCRNGGSCVPTANGRNFTCFCVFPSTGPACDDLIDPCLSSPCGPNGKCYLNIATANFSCVCLNSTFTGPLCQNLTNPCLSSPCVNGSTCAVNGTRFVCQCPPNRTGLFCESFLPPCTNTTCANNGTCLFSGALVTCVCPLPWTGPQCLDRINPCLSNPCLNNGTCFNQLTGTFFCSCPPTWTGNICQTLINPCLTYPCFFGGTCLLDSSFQPFCVCPPTQTGLFCQTTISPCLSSPCLNNGTCFASAASTSYICSCPILYIGARCENLVNPCLPNRCIFGTCFGLNNGSYYCACNPNYTGLICDHPIDQCSLLPCVNGGSCVNLGSSYICQCPAGFTGRSCEQLINPCASNPCRRGSCLSTGTRFVCACDASSTGLLCETLLDPCLSFPCLNNQTCLRDSTNTTYFCLCALPYAGQRCSTTILPCSTLICLNGGTCIQTGALTSQCLCPVGFTGTFCEAQINPCQSQPCFNNGSCLATANNTFICLCPPNYSGALCEQFNPCSTFLCLNGGTCVISSLDIGGRACLCPPGFTGLTCAVPISACTSSPCVNNGICLLIPGTSNFTCLCPAAYTGVFCEVFINPCLSFLCANGGTCVRTLGGTPLCSCLPTFTGAQCITQIDPCLSTPCVNNGICNSLLPIYNYTCRCPANFTGARCENFVGPCSISLCQNGGTCVFNGLNAVSCLCPPTWTGTLCTQRIDPCTAANPCLNNGICLSIFNSSNQTTAVCQCLAGFTGQFCEQRISPCQTLVCINGQCLLRADGTPVCFCNSQWTGAACDSLISACASLPCLNNGICLPLGLNFTCLCPQGYFGSRCESSSPTVCTLNCSNNGTCAIRGQDSIQICLCPPNYTGARCEIQISPCTPSPCLNNGLCLPSTTASGSLSFICICPAPYTGSICATFIPLTCGNSSCFNGGTCFISGNRTICQCPALFTGVRCDMLISPCDSQPCVNGASCQVTGLGRKKRQIVSGIAFLCVCTNGFTGTRCESFLSFCLSNPCTNNGTCTQDFLTNTVRCLCPPNFTGTFCNATNNATNPCTINPGLCVNGGTCRPNASIPQGYTCTCPPTATGVYCEQPIDPCRSSLAPNCTNNGTCISTVTGAQCVCTSGFTGPTCLIPLSPCASQPCFRNGTCLSTGSQSYLCICPTGFSGNRCEICNCPCTLYPCVNGGVCRSTTTGGVVCTCPPGFTGVRCEISTLPCDSNPCLNNGVCLYDPVTMTLTCQCCGLATGRFCEILMNPCNNTIPYCFNGGTCGLDSSNNPVCLCRSTFTGRYCETYSNPCATVTCIQGTCVTLANSSFLCVCPPGRSGRFCEVSDPCVTAPGTVPACRNGGTCNRLGGAAFVCTCPPGFTGAFCDIANPCSSMPCSPNATCATVINGSALCICPIGFTGVRCNETIQSTFCASSPCRNNGTCVGQMCICRNNTSGPTCNTTRVPCPTGARPSLSCANGGTCIPGVGCFCEAGFAGDECETPFFNSCTNTSCLNGGTCRSFANGSIACTCPSGLTGARCDSLISLCLPNPCQFNGTCVPSGTTGYICICAPNFTGPQCGLVANPCLYTPCVNNGTCFPVANGGYTCTCPPAFTGSQCQTILNPCLSNPCNSGACTSINNGFAFICTCPPQLTGPTCLTANACGLQPCLNGGTCVPTSISTYTCVCLPNYIGANCQTLNLCLPNPCVNNGTCTMLSVASISCACTPAFYGDRCQYANPCQYPICFRGVCQVNPLTLTAQCACFAGWTGTLCDVSLACISNPCVFGTCVPLATGGYTCNCTTGYFGAQCQFPIVQSPCQSNPCRNGGTCQVGNNGYICACPASFVGTNCEAINPCLLVGSPAGCQPVLTASGNYTCSCQTNPCSSNPCQYGTCTVINGGLAYRCLCFPSYLGAQCNIPDPCGITTCYNGGTCITTLNSAGTQVNQSCQCPASQTFVGAFCEHYNPCISSPCLNGATCTYYINVTCFYYCTCPLGYSGERCQFSIAQIRCESVGLPNNCRNGGTCMLIGLNTQCFCPSSFTGILCESAVNLCSLRVCQNGGTCSIVNGTNVLCQCPATFQGRYCEYSTDPCSVRPCLNGGQCIPSGLTFSCNCAQTMYTGPRCQTLIASPCVPNPCLNGATCQVIGSSAVCVCASGFTGPTCVQSLNLCSTIQCLNGGSCTNYGTFALCGCLISFTGDRCQFINQCYPTSPCLFGGTCISVMNSFSCQCPTGRTGTTCQLLSDNPCTGQCLNGGTCQVLPGTSQAACLCPAGFTGDICGQAVSALTNLVVTTPVSSSVITILPQSSSTMLQTTSSIFVNSTTAPYICDDSLLACLAYGSYCSREIEFNGIPCRVLCPRTCNTCCEDFYTDGTCSMASCQQNAQLERFCRKTCICRI